MRTSLAVLTLLALSGCERGPTTPADLAVEDTGPAPDLAGTGPLFCTQQQCLPPTCCGNVCGKDTDCCPGTICGAICKCVPESCLACGELGCDVDLASCTAACASPQCCLNPCTDDTTCCPATTCQPDATGTKRCMPKACDTCVGLRPVCQVSDTCDSSCLPPPSCGMVCANDNSCGPDNKCRQFSDNEFLCVPVAFDPICNACGLAGCLFHPDDCTIECAPTTTDMAMSVDASALSDGGDLASWPDLGGKCGACCTGCATDADCCGDQRCLDDGKGHLICQPATCALCSYGCQFFCP